MRQPKMCRSCILIAGLAAALASPGVRAQQAGAAPDEPKTLRELIDASIKSYKVFPDADAKQPAEVLTALRWANNTRGSEDGLTLLFMHGGRPLAACCIYPWAGRLEHDFESLSRDKIVARRDSTIVWQPEAAGVAFADVPEAPPPAATRAMRLRQMKSLAEKFQATLLGWKTDNTDREELRLLSRPLYRYDPKEGPVTDGAVFAFAMGTDPEALLLLEVVKAGADAKEGIKWQYAFARRTSGELEARLDGKTVWKASRFPRQRDPRLPHFTLGTPIPPGLEPAAVEDAKEKAERPKAKQKENNENKEQKP
jgi:hypothetical protein